MSKNNPLALSILATSVLAPVTSNAQTEASEIFIPDSGIEVITISATKSLREINEIAANVTQLDHLTMERLAAGDIRDILRYEPGVSVEGGGRFGLSSFNIRGINGDRVLILMDGIPLADEFSFGPALSARRDFIDVDMLESVEIIRGPASTLYGSDAIGGVVAFTSKQPASLVSQDGELAGRLKLTGRSANDDLAANFQLASTYSNWQWLINAGVRQGHETQTYYSDAATGPVRKSADPLDISSENVFAKMIYSPNAKNQLQLTAEWFNSVTESDLLSDYGAVVRGVTILNSIGDDERQRGRLSMQYQYLPSGLSDWPKVTGLAYIQRSETKQDTQQTRRSLTPNSLAYERQRSSLFEQQVMGAQLQFEQQFSGVGEHYLIYGVQWEETESESVRRGQSIQAETGLQLPEFEYFPARDFPLSTLREVAFFVQDEITLFDGSLMLSPGLRFDRFELTPQDDPVFNAANPNVTITDYSEQQWSAKFGSVYNLTADLNVWWQFAQGFRIPPMDDVNIGFTSFAGGYTSLPNANLKPESVDSHEIGIRYSNSHIDVNVSAYRNDYDNFIESLSVVGFNPATNLLEFQAINIDKVIIEGIDLQVNWYLGATFPELKQWQVRISTSVQQSEDKSTGLALDSVLPNQTVVGLQYGAPDAPWNLSLIATYTGESENLDTGSAETALFQSPSYTTLDLIANYAVSSRLKLNLGLFNLTDKEYWNASEVRGRAIDDNLARFTAPGRNLSANLVYSF
ncbi:TonB-dependent hemoglobin/transferrin/lactoferrin family receptor [Alteromonas flava]|uniref:TonB-dependent hemoglobin/transferrin/lactoferrin family receptor n=1 Tax=Alteromonas flava TaxID=2048003 RepID=UPI000C287BF0|nr:TonB-dependent hemoglobin/transferrin/lactoferrin family receptor [Alteromonas flava]